MMENEKMIKLMDLEFIFILMGLLMKGSGLTINNQESEKRYGLMELDTKGII